MQKTYIWNIIAIHILLCTPMETRTPTNGTGIRHSIH